MCPVNGIPAALITLFCTGAVTIAAKSPATQPASAASSIASTARALAESGRPAMTRCRQAGNARLRSRRPAPHCALRTEPVARPRRAVARGRAAARCRRTAPASRPRSLGQAHTKVRADARGLAAGHRDRDRRGHGPPRLRQRYSRPSVGSCDRSVAPSAAVHVRGRASRLGFAPLTWTSRAARRAHDCAREYPRRRRISPP